MAIKTLKSNRLRSLLTMLGIVIGNASVITLVGVGKGAQNLAKEQSNLGPQITLEVRVDKYNREEFFTSDFPDYDVYAGINFNVDLYSGGRKKSQISVAFEQLNEARYRQAELVKIITANTESLLTELNNAETRVQIFQQAFLANAESRENLKLQFVSANVSLLDLLQAKRVFLESS